MPANECHPIFEPGQRVTGKASAAVTGKRLVKVTGNMNTDGTYPVAHADANAKAFGVSAHDAANGKHLTIIRGSGFIVPITVAAAVAAFEEVKAAAGGKVTPMGDPSGALAASTTIDPAGANNAVVYTAQDEGDAGNGISIAYVDPAGNNEALAIEVNGNDIVVNLATDGAGAITSTADLIKAAIAADPDANALVSSADAAGNDGSGVVTAIAATNLAGGADPGQGAVAIGFAMTAQATVDADAEIALYQ